MEEPRDRDADRHVARVQERRRRNGRSDASARVQDRHSGELSRSGEGRRGHDDGCPDAHSGRPRENAEGDAEGDHRDADRHAPPRAVA